MTVPPMAAGDFQCRDDGHGRAALQFRQCEEGAADRLRRRRPSLSKRRITLSTSGVVPEITRCGNEIGVMLAISLHAVRDELRDELVPINKKYPKELARGLPHLSWPVERAAHHVSNTSC
jgi:hypothetical protein